MFDWSKYPGPQHYDPSQVEPALSSLRSARTQQAAHEAYNRVLFAIGNNHAGSLYPAVTGAAPEILRIALTGSGWARRGAVEVLVEFCCFDAEAGFESYLDSCGRTIDVRAELDRLLLDKRAELEAVFRDSDIDDQMRTSLTEILESLPMISVQLSTAPQITTRD